METGVSGRHYSMNNRLIIFLGTFIPIEDHHLLREDFEEFQEGEYVGYEIEDDLAHGQTFVYAIIMEKVSNKYVSFWQIPYVHQSDVPECVTNNNSVFECITKYCIWRKRQIHKDISCYPYLNECLNYIKLSNYIFEL